MSGGTVPRRDSDAPLRIGTRSSELALRQARTVQRTLAERGLASELVTYTTIGDRRLDQPLASIGAKGLFTAELEEDLRAGHVDCCVHSLKDLPTESPPGVEVVAVLEREDPRDALVLGPGVHAEGVLDLPQGAVVGTSSLRRRALLLALRPDLRVVELRGNVPTRLRKVDEGQVQAAVLAAAGLRRLGVGDRIAAYLEAPHWLPAAGQGAIAIQVRAEAGAVRDLFTALDHAPTMRAVRAERSMLSALGGGCQVPIAALAVNGAEGATLHGLVLDLAGAQLVRGSEPLGAHDDPEEAGRRLAATLVRHGAGEILTALQGATGLAAPQPE
jgi:hydroxymethylbilane synthase